MSTNVTVPYCPSPRTQGVRRKLRRNRKISYPPGSVITDGKGNITSRPHTQGLPCFGDPIEYLYGRFDRPRQWGDKDPEPNGCAMCPVGHSCGRVVHERLENTPGIRDQYYDWEKAASGLAADECFLHPKWSKFAESCEQAGWTDENDRSLEQLAEAKRAEARLKAASKSRSRRRRKVGPKKIPKRMERLIQEYRDARVHELLEQRNDPDAPLWLRNRSEERCILIADAWQAREILEREGKKSSAPAVFQQLVENKRLNPDGPQAIAKRIGEILRLADKLVDSNVWPIFDPDGPPAVAAPGKGMHPSTVHTLLDDVE